MMHITKFNDEVLYTDDPIVEVSWADIQGLKQAALSNPRRRIRLCGHRDVGATLHEMLIVHTRDTYVRPHKHLNKSESFHVIEGVADIVVFDDSGNVTAVVSMGDYASGRKFFYRLSDPCFHTLLITSEFFVFHETTSGPFVRTDTVFAPWAPEDKDEAAGQRFLEETSHKSAHYLSQHANQRR